jgi:hypothetical protein
METLEDISVEAPAESATPPVTGLLQSRLYNPERDCAMVSEWAEDHRRTPFAKELLPPLGVVVERDGEPVAALWCYMSVGVGIGFLEWPVTKPGLSMRESKAAMKFAVEAIIEAARVHDYHLFRVFTLPGIARVLRSEGWHSEGPDRVPLQKYVA